MWCERITGRLSSFFLFCADHREQAKKENPDAGVADISKVLGGKWSKISASEKKKYEDQAAKLKEAYNKAKGN